MEGLLGLVIGRIGSVLADEAAKRTFSPLYSEGSLHAGINGSMRRIQRVFKEIEPLLGEIDRNRINNNEIIGAWLKDVRKIGHDTEDVIDEYMYLITEESEYKFMGINCSAMKKATNFRAWLRIAARLNQIEKDTDYGFAIMRAQFNLGKFNSGEGSSQNLVSPSLNSYDLEVDEIIGMEKEKETLIGWMRDEAARENLVITVWGMGGSGKTTLVNSVYRNKEIVRHFDLTVWLSVSQTFGPRDLLRRIYKSLASIVNKEAEREIEGMDFDYLAEKTRAFLHDRRFLIILDDVWDPDAYFMLENIFSVPKPGSKIVITTRSKDVARLANEQCQMEHRTLQPDEAWELFCWKAFWKDGNRKCSQEVEEWGRKIVNKCGGLPLAIVAIARVMSLKEPHDWKHMYDRLSWEFTCNPALDRMKHILTLSYYDLPSYLKNCFLYFSIFPEDYEIERKLIIKLWVAEGFVQSRGTQTVEDVAEDYFNELLHRSMLQVAHRNILGKVKTYRMHDLIRELTLRAATDENFSTVVTNSQSSWSSAVLNEARKLSVHGSCWPEECVNLSRVRSLFLFGNRAELPMSMLSSKTTRFLRVLHLRGADVTELPDTVGDLFNLHYLNLSWTDIKRLPSSIGRLHNLQTLDLRETGLRSLPRETTKLKNLRSLAISNDSDTMNFNAPKGLWELTCLQDLQIYAEKELVRRLGNLTLLRKLKIHGVEGSYCPHLFSSPLSMKFLNKLHISSSYDCDKHMHADLSLLVDSLGDDFRDLGLRFSGLRDDPLPLLSRLSNLTKLQLDDAYNGERLCFGCGWFPKLKYLSLRAMTSLSEIIFEKGSLGSLEKLELSFLSDLKQVPHGIEFQRSIKSLEIHNCVQLLGEMMRGEQKYFITHIRTVRIRGINRNGQWVDEVIN